VNVPGCGVAVAIARPSGPLLTVPDVWVELAPHPTMPMATSAKSQPAPSGALSGIGSGETRPPTAVDAGEQLLRD
jgi:hypothetical protein